MPASPHVPIDRPAIDSPASPARLDALVAAVAATGPATVLDVGCGQAELLLRVLSAVPTATGVGIDSAVPLIERGRDEAQRRGLADRVRLDAGDARTADLDPAEAVLCVGAWHAAAADVPAALRSLRAHTVDGGRLLCGIDHWSSTPPPQRLAATWGGVDLDASQWLPDVVDAAAAAGWRMLDLQQVSQDEWNAYECGLVRGQEEWLLAHPDHPDAAATRRRLDEGRRSWLRGHHGYLGFAWILFGALPDPG